MATYFVENTNNVEDIEQMNKIVNKVSKVNTTAIGNIGQLTELNNKAEKLSEDIQQALPINKELKENIRIGQPLVQESTTKNTELTESLEKAKKYIDGLNGSQNIPQIRLDVTELQNGLKSNQFLSYEGVYISANNTLPGRTEEMIIKGKTMYKKKDETYTDTWEEGVTLESFGEKEDNKINILSHGKNLIKEIERGNLNSNTGEDAAGGTELLFRTKGYVNIKPSSNYIISCNLDINSGLIGFFYDENKKMIKTFSTLSAITPNNAKYLRFRARKSDNTNLTDLEFNSLKIQLEEGTIATPCEPYKQDKKDILIKEPLREGDYLYEDNGQVKVYREAREYTFTGDEGFTIVAQPSDESLIRFQYFDEHRNIKAYGSGYCNNFMFVKGINSLTNGECIGTHTTGNNLINIIVKRSKLSTQNVEGLKAWLRENPTTVIYQLDKPVTEVVENCVDIDLDTFQDKTYFSIENSLPGTLDFKVPSNIASIVQNTAREVNNIWDVINNLLVPSLIDINKNVAVSTIKNNLK